jgi:NAD(P)-dependent dehydrogenase (short-subunit alcohol dehydrogenase family)
LSKQFSELQIAALDVSDFAQIEVLAAKWSEQKIDILLCNAGVYGDVSGGGLGHIDYQKWLETFKINTQGPLKMVEAFLPHVRRGNKKLIASVSSLMGSMADNTSGGSYLYRSSKAALNAVMKSLALDLAGEGIGVLILHPGWVKTDMGGVNAMLETDFSIRGMIRVMDEFQPSQSGQFLKYDGSLMPW